MCALLFSHADTALDIGLQKKVWSSLLACAGSCTNPHASLTIISTASSWCNHDATLRITRHVTSPDYSCLTIDMIMTYKLGMQSIDIQILPQMSLLHTDQADLRAHLLLSYR